MNTELFIENRRVDITAYISTLLNFAIDDIKDFASRSTTWSKTIVLPGTANNNKLFGHIFQLGQSNATIDVNDNVGYNFNASKAADCIIFQDQMQTFKGVLRLMQINITKGQIEYEVAVFGELAGLNVALSSGFLHDLDFSEYDHTYLASGITASWANTSGTGVYYPLIDYGTYSTVKKDWDIRTFRPALHVREYIDKMMTAANFRWTSDLFDTARFKTLIVPHNQKKLKGAGTIYIDCNVSGTQTFTPVSASKINFPSTVEINAFTPSDANQHTFNYDDPATISPRITATVSGTYYSNGISIYIGIFRLRGAGPEELLEVAELVSTGGTTLVAFSKTVTVQSELIQNDDIYCKVYNFNISVASVVNITSGNLLVEPAADESIEISYGGDVIVNNCIPKNIRQIDFLSGIIKLFNLYVYEDSLDRRLIHFKPYVDFYPTSGYPANISFLHKNSGFATTGIGSIGSQTYVAGKLYILFAGTTNPTNPATVSLSGGTWTEIANIVSDGGDMRLQAFRFAPAVDTTTAVTIIYTGSQNGGYIQLCEIRGADVSGTNGSNAIVQAVTNAIDASANPSITMMAIANARNSVIAGFINNRNPFGGTAESGWTEQHEGGYATPDTGGIYITRAMTTDNTPTITAAASNWAGIAIEIKSQDSESIDWTYKLNRDKTLKIRPMSEINAKIYNFKHKPDSDFYNELYKKRYNQGYGDYVFDSQFEFADSTKSFEIVFSATPLVGYTGEDKIFPTIFKQSNGVEENIDSNIRILQSKKITGVTSWDIMDGASVLASTTDYGYAGHFDDPDAPSNDLNFGALEELFFTLVSGDLSTTQFNVYWSAYMAEITDKDSKLLSAWFYLTAKDILTLDFSKLIWIDGVLFRLNAIKDYNASNISDCECELLKVNYLIY